MLEKNSSTDRGDSPLTFACGKTMKNRFMLAPLTNQQSHEDGTLSDEEFHWLTMRAKGQFGIVMTCATSVQAHGKCWSGQLGIHSDIHIPGHQRLTSRIQAEGSLAVVQLHHGGMRCPAEFAGGQAVCPSDNEEHKARAMSITEVEGLRDDFIAAAVRAQRSGYDGVEIHGAHGYLIAQFLSNEINRRTDIYGGSLENRSRILFEILKEIRDAYGGDFLLGVRLSPERFGMDLSEVKILSQQLIDTGMIDFLDISLWDSFKHPEGESKGGKTLLEHITELDYKDVHLTVAGKIYGASEVQKILNAGVDFVTIGRSAILHHDFPARVIQDSAFRPIETPVSTEHLKQEGLSDKFIHYMRRWKGFVVETILLVFVLSLSSYQSNLSAQNFIWAKSYGGIDHDEAHDSAVDLDGNVYTTGLFAGTVDFDPGPGIFNLTSNSPTYWDLFVTKLDSNGNFCWAKAIGGSSDDRGESIAVAASGNIYVTGRGVGNVSLGPGSLNCNTMDAILIKLDTNGNVLWGRNYGGNNNDEARGLDIDQDENVYLTGTFEDSISFVPGNPFYSKLGIDIQDIFVLKVDSSGNFGWATVLGGQSYDQSYELDTDHQKNVYVTGRFMGTAEYDPDPNATPLTAYHSEDAFVCKLDSNGTYQWNRQFGGPFSEWGNDVKVDHSGNVAVVGRFNDTIYLDPTLNTFPLVSPGSIDGFVCKLDPNGNTLFASRFGGVSYCSANGIDFDQNNNVFLTGGFIGTGDFAPGPATFHLTSTGVHDVFLAKLHPDLTLDWAVNMGGALGDIGESVNLDPYGNIYVSGHHSSPADMDPGPNIYNISSGSSWDLFNCKLGQCPRSFDTIAVVGCDSVSVNGQTYFTPGNYTQTLINAVGCDSILTIEFTDPSTDSTLVMSFCDSLQLNGQVFHSTGYYVQTLTNSVGCDSTLTLFLTERSSGATLNLTSCDSISLNGQTYHSSGTYTQTLTNAAGCDSTLTLNVSISQPTASTQTLTDCDSLQINGQTYFSSGTYLQTLTNAQGCDSILNLDLQIEATPMSSILQSGDTLMALPGGMSYQWIDCDGSNSIIPGEVGQSFAPLVSGVYAVVVSDSNCSDTSTCFPIVITASEITGIGIGCTVSPNPNSGSFRVFLDREFDELSYELTEASGRVIAQDTTYNTQVLELNLDLAKGMYFLLLSSQGNSTVKKILIE